MHNSFKFFLTAERLCFDYMPHFKFSYCELAIELISELVSILLTSLDSIGTIVSIRFQLVFFVERFIVG